MLMLIPTASAGYGDPVDGIPSHTERLLHLWTNAARVAPEEFEDDYNNGYEPCSFYEDFGDDEQTAKPPVYIDLDLTEVARVHSEDMKDNGCFQHESCDGTDTWDRIAEYYDDTTWLGENIAYGTTDMRYAVMGLWMCSESGHRANIMSADWNELGAGVASEYQTQDFAAGSLELGDPPVRMAVDDGETFYADWGDDETPALLQIVLGGVAYELELTFGAEDQGIYSVDIEIPEDCVAWYVAWESEAGDAGTFPEDGSWLVGSDCEGSDGADDWTDEQQGGGGLFDDVQGRELKDHMLDDITLSGCATVNGASGLGWLAGLLAIRRRR